MEQSLLVFITVAEQQSFTQTAKLLHMTQPAVSQYIQTLERSMDTTLLERNNKYVRLTRSGEIVYHYAKDIVSLYTRMAHLLDDLNHTASGRLLIGSSFTYGEYILPYKIAALLNHYPQIQPAITIKNTNEIIDLMLHHHLDVGIIEGEATSDQLRIMPFARDHLSVVMPSNHPLLSRKKTVSAHDLHEETWLIREDGSGTRSIQEKGLNQLGVSPHKVMKLGSNQVIKESIEAGLGISLLSHAAVKNEVAHGKFSLLNLDGFPLSRKFSLVLPRTGFQTKATEVFVNLLLHTESKS